MQQETVHENQRSSLSAFSILFRNLELSEHVCVVEHLTARRCSCIGVSDSEGWCRKTQGNGESKTRRVCAIR